MLGDLPSIDGDEDPELVRREDGSWLIDGRMAIERLKQHLKLKRLPKRHAGDYNTVGGFMMAHLGRVPRSGDHFEWRGFRFEVVDMDRQRVDKILVQRQPREKDAKGRRKSAAPLPEVLAPLRVSAAAAGLKRSSGSSANSSILKR